MIFNSLFLKVFFLSFYKAMKLINQSKQHSSNNSAMYDSGGSHLKDEKYDCMQQFSHKGLWVRHYLQVHSCEEARILCCTFKGSLMCKIHWDGWLFGLTISQWTCFCAYKIRISCIRETTYQSIGFVNKASLFWKVNSLTQIIFLFYMSLMDGGETKIIFSTHVLRNSDVKLENRQNWGATNRIVFTSQVNPHLELNRSECYYCYYAPTWFAQLSLQCNLESLTRTETNDYVARVTHPSKIHCERTLEGEVLKFWPHCFSKNWILEPEIGLRTSLIKLRNLQKHTQVPE